MQANAAVLATLADLDRQPDRPVRVILTVRPGEPALQQVIAAARKAGATTVDPIRGQPLVVVEGKPAQLRTAVATGLVLQIDRDAASPTN